MLRSPSESQQTQTFSVDHENVLPEHYRLIELIGRGGMAEVYLAEDRRLGRKVAIKFLSREFRRDPDRVRRFRQEARSASALNHPNILIIHDIGDRNGVQFIVSEFVEGETLGTRIAQGRIPFAEAVDVAIQVASALSAAHVAGIVHRDIKPDNIMIRRDGVVKVLDFGLAKARGFTSLNGSEFDATTTDTGSTSPGLIVGTPQYMSPEQARGKELDGRTDIFSLGIIIFEMITRHSPFAGGSFADTMAAILTKEPRRIEEFVEDAPARLIGLVDKCLRKERDERFASMSELEGELKLLRTEVISTPKDTAEIDPAKSDRTEIRPTHQHSIRRFVSNTFEHRPPWAVPIILLSATLLIGGWWSWDRLSLTPATPSLMRTVPITSWSGTTSELVTSASFSPDGRMIAFARKAESREVWVKPVSGGDAVQVTKDGGSNQYPVWSADGHEIAFISDRGNNRGIWRVPYTGGHVTSIAVGITPSARLVDWDTDGWIYFQSGREMFRVLANGGNAEQITDFSNLGSNIRTIEISHDGKLVAYSVLEESIWKIRIRDLDSRSDREIASAKDQIDHIAWHPDGRGVFASFLIDGILQVVEAATDGSGAIQRSNGDLNFIVHDVSENGSVLYGTLSETSDLWRVRTDTAVETIVANDVPLEYWPDVANDGSIAFQSGTCVERPDLSSITIPNLGTTSQAVSVSTNGFIPSWSNSGDWIAFFRKGAKGLEIWKSRPNGIDLTRVSDADVTAPGYSFAPYLLTSVSNIAWSPDDSKVAFAARENGDSRLWISATDGSSGTFSISNDGGFEINPIWTQDGQGIVFTSIAGTSPNSPDRRYRILHTNLSSGETRLLFESRKALRVLGFRNGVGELVFTLNLDDAEKALLADTIEVYTLSLSNGNTQKIRSLQFTYHLNVHFTQIGDVLAFVTREGDRTAIVTVPLVDGATKEHLVVNDPKILISSLGLSRDGSFIVFGKQTRTNLLSMLTN